MSELRVLLPVRSNIRTGTFVVISGVFLSLFLLSCTPIKEEEPNVTTVLDSLKQQYAPDGRTAVYDITTELEGSTMVLKGEVDNTKAKDESLAAVRKMRKDTVLDSVKVLPDPQLGENKFGIVAVSVANVRTKPGHPNELCTQALMGTVVKLLKKHDGWYYVQLPDRYLGWLEESAMEVTTAAGVEAWKSADKVIVTNYFAIIRALPKSSALPVSDAVTGMLLKFISRQRSWVEAGLPDGRHGYVEAASVEDFETWKQTRRLTPENIEKTAKMFIGVPYLWGGTSPKGMDCSGFTKTVFRLNGMELSRDADQQAEMGEAVEPGRDFSNLKKGDLLFFGKRATANKPERITHVGIYLEKGEFIHSPGGAGVKMNSFDSTAPDFSKFQRNRFVRARRLIGAKQVSELRRR